MNRMYYPEIRGRILALELKQEDVAEKIQMSYRSFNVRLNRHKEWKLSECYRLLEVLKLDPSELPRYFPPDGGEKKINALMGLTEGKT